MLQSTAWADYLAGASIQPFVNLLLWLKSRIEMKSERNSPLHATKETARLRRAYESDRIRERFYELVYQCIREIYGPIELSDFNSQSAMHGFFAHRQNLIRGTDTKPAGRSGKYRGTRDGWSMLTSCLYRGTGMNTANL